MTRHENDGFYEVHFAALDQGAGLIVIEEGKVRGGDAQSSIPARSNLKTARPLPSTYE